MIFGTENQTKSSQAYEKDTENPAMDSPGAGVRLHWRRYWGLLEQVWGAVGAGVEKGWRPAPVRSRRRPICGTGPREKPHLRQDRAGPAPSFPLQSLGILEFLWNVLDNH